MSSSRSQPPSRRTRFEAVVYTRQTAEVFPLVNGSSIGIGRSSENLIRVDDPSVSRQHARFTVRGAEVEAEDLGSSNGSTMIRGTSEPDADEETVPGAHFRLAPYRPTQMRVGDSLRVGPAVISLQRKGQSSLSQLQSAPPLIGPPVLLDEVMKQAYDLIAKGASSEISILILGETGAGKEVMAETVHRRSPRCNGPFLRLNCAALSESLLESELFGHERGAFTGAHAAKAGLLESTDGGTVFLDEIGEMRPGTQAKLLRVLEERKVLRVGATRPKSINVRFVTATNRDLAREVGMGRFRGDLYYRISGLVVRIPPLRERPAELEPLARFFLRQFCQHMGQVEPHISDPARDVIRRHHWPGNVRELRNVMERAALLCQNGIISREHVMLEPADPMMTLVDGGDFEDQTQVTDHPHGQQQGKPSLLTPVKVAVHEDERDRVIHALETCGGNQTRAAQMLGVSRRTLINRLETWKLPRPKKKA